MKQLSGQDASFLYSETSENPMHTATIYIYDQSTSPGGIVSFKAILEMLESRLHLAPVLRRRIVRVPMDMDHPYWIEDPDFDLEFHVRHIALPKPGDWRQLCIQAARLHSRPLDLNRPLWEINVIEGLDNVEGIPSGSFAFVLKMHHAAVDGVSGIELITALHDLVPGVLPPGPTSKWVTDTVPQPWELLARASVNQALRPFQFAEAMSRMMPAVSGVTPRAARAMTAQAQPPRTRFNVTLSAHRVVDGLKVPLSGVKQIRASLERATVNDAMLAVVSGGLRRYLQSKAELPTESLLTMVPVSVRDPKTKSDGGNQVASMVVPLHTNIENPQERFAAIRDSTLGAKAALEAIGARNLTEFAQFLPGGLIGAATRLNAELRTANQVTPAFNVVVTNVPGPQVPMYTMGAKLIATYGMGPIYDGMGLMNIITSYCGEVYLAFTASREVMSDPAFYTQCLRESYDELLAPTASAPASTVKAPVQRPVKKQTRHKAPANSAAATLAAKKSVAPKKSAAPKKAATPKKSVVPAKSAARSKPIAKKAAPRTAAARSR